MTARIVRTLAAVLTSAGTLVFGQDTALLQDERNTVEVFRTAGPGVVHVEARAAAETKFEKRVIEAGTASGFFVDGDGRVLTNAHVIAGRNEIDVVLGSGRRLSARKRPRSRAATLLASKSVAGFKPATSAASSVLRPPVSLSWP